MKLRITGYYRKCWQIWNIRVVVKYTYSFFFNRETQNYLIKGQQGNLCGTKAFHCYSVSWKAWWTFCYRKVLIFGKEGAWKASSGTWCASDFHFVAIVLSGAGSEFQAY